MSIEDLLASEIEKNKLDYKHKFPFNLNSEIRLLVSAPSGSGKTFAIIKDIIPILDFSKLCVITKCSSIPHMDINEEIQGGQPIYRALKRYCNNIKKPISFYDKEDVVSANLFTKFSNQKLFPKKTLILADDFETKKEFEKISEILGTIRPQNQSIIIITQSPFNLPTTARSNLSHIMAFNAPFVGATAKSLAEIVSKTTSQFNKIIQHLDGKYDYVILPSFSNEYYCRDNILQQKKDTSLKETIAGNGINTRLDNCEFEDQEDIIEETKKEKEFSFKDLMNVKVGNGINFKNLLDFEPKLDFKQLLKK